jgi:hypothetical protein
VRALRSFAFWILLAVIFVSAAGLAGILALERAIDRAHEDRSRACSATAKVVDSLGAILGSFVSDPSVPVGIKSTILQEQDQLSAELEAIHHCPGA